MSTSVDQVDAVVDADRVSRVFTMAAGPVTAVDDITLRVAPGDYLAIRGPSGCGKSTLLHMLGCVDTPTHGTLRFRGEDVSRLSDARRSLLGDARAVVLPAAFYPDAEPLPWPAQSTETPLPQDFTGAGAARAGEDGEPASPDGEGARG